MSSPPSEPESFGDPTLDDRFEWRSTVRASSSGSTYAVRDRRSDASVPDAWLDIVPLPGVEPPRIAVTLESWHTLVGDQHPRRVPILDLGVWRDGAYILRRAPNGPALRDALDARAALEAMAPRSAVSMARQLLEALGSLHRRGLFAHAPSPEDVVLGIGDDGGARATLADLGVGRALREVARPATSTLFVGRLRYAAPETFDGSAAAGPAADLYAVGLILYEALTGRFPIAGDSPSTLLAGHVLHPPLDFAESDPEGRVPESLRQVTSTLLAKSPDDRFADAAAASMALEAAVAELPPAGPADWRLWLASADPAAGVTTRMASPSRVAQAPPPAPEAPPEVPTVEPTPPAPPPRDESTPVATSTSASASASTTDLGPAPGSVTVPMSLVEAAKARERRRAAEAASAASPHAPSRPAAPPADPLGTVPSPSIEPASIGAADVPAADVPASDGPAFDELGFDVAPSPPLRHQARRSPPGRSTARITTALLVGAILIGIFLASFKLSGGSIEPGQLWAKLGDAVEQYRASSTSTADETASTGDLEAAAPEGTPDADGDAASFDAFDAANAEPGALRLDASPWAEVQITDAAGAEVPIAGARVTPRRVELAPGRYEITFVYPPGDGRESRSIQLGPGGVESVRVDFGIEPEDYFRHVGY